jgi:hypothetical protein
VSATVKAGRRKPSSGRPVPAAEQVVVANTHPALIDKATFDLVQNRLAANRVRKSPRKTVPFALSGLLVCGHCGRRMIAFTSHVRSGDKVHKYRQYTCASYHVNGVASGCGRNTVEERRITAAVAQKFTAAFTRPEVVAALKAEILRQEQADAGPGRGKELESCEADLTKQGANLIRQLATDLPEAALADVRGEISKLSGERDRVREELATVRASRVAEETLTERVERFVGRVYELQEVIETGNPAAVSALFRELIGRLECYFVTTRTAKRTRAVFAKSLIHPNSDGWLTPRITTLSPESASRPSRTPAASAAS